MNKVRIATFSLAMFLSCGVQGLSAGPEQWFPEIEKVLKGFDPARSDALGEYARNRRKSILGAILENGALAVAAGDISPENFEALKKIVQPIYDSKVTQYKESVAAAAVKWSRECSIRQKKEAKKVFVLFAGLGLAIISMFSYAHHLDLKDAQSRMDPSWYAQLGTRQNLLIAGGATLALGGLYALWRNRPVSNEVEAAL